MTYDMMSSFSMWLADVTLYADVRKASEVLGYGVGALSMLLFVAVKPGRVASALLAISIGSSGLTTSGVF